jgi:hypothetical protein
MLTKGGTASRQPRRRRQIDVARTRRVEDQTERIRARLHGLLQVLARVRPQILMRGLMASLPLLTAGPAAGSSETKSLASPTAEPQSRRIPDGNQIETGGRKGRRRQAAIADSQQLGDPLGRMLALTDMATRLPTRLRTMWCRKAEASKSKTSRSPKRRMSARA